MHFNLHVCIIFTSSGILKGSHLALQVEVQARSTYRTLTMLISICIGLKSFQNGQISLLWYGVVNGILPSNPHFADASALYWSTASTQHDMCSALGPLEYRDTGRCVNTTMGGGLHNASHLCCHRPGGAVHVEVLEAKVENPRRVNHDMARDLLTSYTAQENLESSPFSGDNLGWSNCSSQRIANMTCGDLYIISPCHCARLSRRKIQHLRKGTVTAPVLPALGQTAELLPRQPP